MSDLSLPSDPQWKKNLDEAVLLTTATMLKHAEMIADHREWLASHILAMRGFDEGMEELRATQAETAQKLDKLVTILLGGANGRSQS
jgi:hypothetical protein